MKYFFSLPVLLLCLNAHADNWTGVDKSKHFAVSGILGGAAYAYTHNRTQAFGLALLPGILKEVADSQSDNKTFNEKDLAWDALGAAVGVQAGHWIIDPERITYSAHF